MCVLRASGPEFDPDAFLGTSPLQPSKVFRRGESRLPRSKPEGPRHEASGISIDVSDASWRDLSAQIADAERFIKANRLEIKRLAKSPGITDLTLDFPIESRMGGENVVAQFDKFPATLVSLAGALGIALELSIYPCSDE